jgi:hypothetical protein
MALRWTAAGMLAAEAQFRRVKGFRELPALLAALEEATAEQPGANTLDSVSQADPTIPQHPGVAHPSSPTTKTPPRFVQPHTYHRGTPVRSPRTDLNARPDARSGAFVVHPRNRTMA